MLRQTKIYFSEINTKYVSENKKFWQTVRPYFSDKSAKWRTKGTCVFTYPMCLTSPTCKNFDVLYVPFVSYVPNIWRTLRHLRAKNIWHALRTLRTVRAKNVGMLYVPYVSKILASPTCQKFTGVTYASYLPKILANRTWHMWLKYRHFSWNLSIFTVEELNCYHYSI